MGGCGYGALQEPARGREGGGISGFTCTANRPPSLPPPRRQRAAAARPQRRIKPPRYQIDLSNEEAVEAFWGSLSTHPFLMRKGEKISMGKWFTLRESPPAHPNTATSAKSTAYRDLSVISSATMPRGVALIREVWERTERDEGRGLPPYSKRG